MSKLKASCSALLSWPLPHFHSLFFPSGALWINLSLLEPAFPQRHSVKPASVLVWTDEAELVTIFDTRGCRFLAGVEEWHYFISELVQYTVKTNSSHNYLYAFLKIYFLVNMLSTVLGPESKPSTNVAGWFIDQASSPRPCPERLPMLLLKVFAAAHEHPASETPAFRWNHTEKKKHLHSKEPTTGMTGTWLKAFESPISLLFSNFTFLKMNHWCGKRTPTLLWIHLHSPSQLGVMGDLPNLSFTFHGLQLPLPASVTK